MADNACPGCGGPMQCLTDQEDDRHPLMACAEGSACPGESPGCGKTPGCVAGHAWVLGTCGRCGAEQPERARSQETK